MEHVKHIVIILFLLSLGSCMPKPPYEVKSPCVSNDNSVFEDGVGITPCPRRPVNFGYKIA